MEVSIRCYYPNGGKCDKRQNIHPGDLMKWFDCYFFTHPDCIAISIKVWREDITGEYLTEKESGKTYQ